MHVPALFSLNTRGVSNRLLVMELFSRHGPLPLPPAVDRKPVSPALAPLRACRSVRIEDRYGRPAAIGSHPRRWHQGRAARSVSIPPTPPLLTRRHPESVQDSSGE